VVVVEISYPRRGDRARTFRAAPRATATGNTRCSSVEEGPLFYGGPLLPLIRIPEVSVYRGQEKEREEMPLFALSPSVLIRSVPRTARPLAASFASFISYHSSLYDCIMGRGSPREIGIGWGLRDTVDGSLGMHDQPRLT